MRNKILGIIGILWGGGVLLSLFIRKAPFGNGDPAYAAGAAGGFVFAAVMLAAGIYYVRK